MKSILVVLFISLSVSTHAYKIEENAQMRPNNSIHLDCFDVFIPLINRVSYEAKETSGACVATADAQKERELISINRTRSELFSEVKRIKETLSTCSTQNDHLGYFECLKGIIEADRKIVGDITMKSSKYSNKIKEIEEEQVKCFRNSVFKVKERSANAMHSLQFCLTSGETLGGRDTTSTTNTVHTTSTPFYTPRHEWIHRRVQ